jgi:hypothetical protein
MQATAARARIADRALLILRTDVALLEEVDVDLEPETDDVAVSPAVRPEFELDVGGATAERALMLDHAAAALAPLLPCV